jgi:hypothetical protein
MWNTLLTLKLDPRMSLILIEVGMGDAETPYFWLIGVEMNKQLRGRLLSSSALHLVSTVDSNSPYLLHSFTDQIIHLSL